MLHFILIYLFLRITSKESFKAQVMFMKYYDLNLKEEMNNGIDGTLFKQIFSNLIYSLSYLKFKKIYCSSLKPENIFLEK